MWLDGSIVRAGKENYRLVRVNDEGQLEIVLVDGADGTAVSVEARSQAPTKNNALQVQIGPGDPLENFPVFVDSEHHHVHEGETYETLNQQLSLGTGTVKYSFTVPVYSPTIHAPHLVTRVDVYNGAARVDLYEGATFTGGSDLTAMNKNRNSSNTPGASAKTGVTSTDGTLIDSFFGGAGLREAGAGRADSEWITKSNTIYRIDLVGLVAGTQAILHFQWYEDLGV